MTRLLLSTGIALLTSGCIRTGLDVPLYITASMTDTNCSDEFPDWNGDGICSERDIYLGITQPDGKVFVPEHEYYDGLIEAWYSAPYQLIRDYPVNCLGEETNLPPPEPGQPMVSSFILTAYTAEGYDFPELGLSVDWDVTLDDGNPDKQGFNATDNDPGALCIQVGSLRYGLGDEANAGLPPADWD